MKTLTKTELVSILLAIRGTTFISIESRTKPKLRKGNPFVSLEKVSKICGAIGFNYQNSVNNQRERENLEQDFKSHQRKWGTRIEKTPLVEHNGKYYLEVKVQNSDSNYFSNNNRIENQHVYPWMYAKKTRQEVKDEIILRDYSVDSIKRITINKEEFVVV